MSTSTGPGRPVDARWNASAIVCGISAASVTRKLCLVIGMVMPRDVGLLEAVGADQRRGHLAGDRDDRHRVHVRVGDRGDQVGGARTGRRHADPDLAGGLRVTGGRVPGALLVADQDVPDLRGVQQRVVDGQDRAAGDAEDDLAADLLQRADERLGAGHGDVRRGLRARNRDARGDRGLGRGGRPGRWRRFGPGRGVAVVIWVGLAARSVGSGQKKTPDRRIGGTRVARRRGLLRRRRAWEVRGTADGHDREVNVRAGAASNQWEPRPDGGTPRTLRCAAQEAAHGAVSYSRHAARRLPRLPLVVLFALFRACARSPSRSVPRTCG